MLPILHAFYLLVAVAAIALVTERWRVVPFLAIVAASAAFGLAHGDESNWVAKDFGYGFVQSLESSGLVILAGTLVAALAEGGGGAAWIAAKTTGWRARVGSVRMLAPLGFIAGFASTPLTAFAVLTPIRQALGGTRAKVTAALTIALSIAAAHGTMLPAPVPVAAAAILRADWSLVASYGWSVALVSLIVGSLFSRVAGSRLAESETAVEAPGRHLSARVGVALILTTLMLVALLVSQSLGQIPSEPFGGGPKREAILGAGRPLIILVGGVGLMLLALGPAIPKAIAERGWLDEAQADCARLVLAVGAAGGLQFLVQATGMADLLTERILDRPLGLALPFLLAAINKTLQGSSLTAAITTAGMIQPLLGAIGLEDASGRALAVVAIGAGSMCISHMNDGFFWLVTQSARLRPAQGLATLSLGTLIQGASALGTLYLIAPLVR